MSINKTVNSKLIYDGFIKLYEDEILLENGVKHKFSLIKQKQAASVIPVTKDQKVILVKQFRAGIGQYTLEIPAGILDENETHEQCAKRELLEETGYSSENIEFFCEYSPAAGITDEILKMYIAKDVIKVDKLNLDDTEVITVHEFTLKQALEMINEGLIIDSKTIIGILKYSLELQ